MAIMRWDPFGEILKMQRDMDRIFTRVGAGEAPANAAAATSGVISSAK